MIVFTTENIKTKYERLIESEIKLKKVPTKTEWEIEAIFDDGCGNYMPGIESNSVSIYSIAST
ncbi:MAG: hypothetical protein JEZ03_16340 [Bacteroidales bacterium]|nr:hypothetical protein [Bacteroidales bacterium]